VGIEPNTGRALRIDEMDCPQTGRQSGKCQRMRHFSIADVARTNHMFWGKLEIVRCAVPLLIPVASVISRHDNALKPVTGELLLGEPILPVIEL
jgi:hypothetical protein